MTEATIQQESNRTKASIASFIFHALLLAILFFYRFSSSELPPPITAIEIDMGDFAGGGGDNAAAGMPDEGQGNDPAPQGDPNATDNQPAEEPAPSEPAPSTPPPSEPSHAKPSPAAEVPKNTPTAPDPNTAAVRQAEERKRQEQEKARQEQEQQRRETEAAAQRERDRIAAEKAEQARQQAERDKKKGQFGGTFGKPGASGTGQGNTGKPGNQGIPGGTGDNPFGKSSGTGGGSGGGSGSGSGGSVGDGFGNRRVTTWGKVNDDSQVGGKVVVEVCVDASGRVISAESVSRGATTSDPGLRNKAVAAAKSTRFQPSDTPKQCGTLIWNFRLQ